MRVLAMDVYLFGPQYLEPMEAVCCCSLLKLDMMGQCASCFWSNDCQAASKVHYNFTSCAAMSCQAVRARQHTILLQNYRTCGMYSQPSSMRVRDDVGEEELRARLQNSAILIIDLLSSVLLPCREGGLFGLAALVEADLLRACVLHYRSRHLARDRHDLEELAHEIWDLKNHCQAILRIARGVALFDRCSDSGANSNGNSSSADSDQRMGNGDGEEDDDGSNDSERLPDSDDCGV